MKIVTVVGVRPQFIKAKMVSEALRRVCEETVIHTGQHYDYEMSQVFFEELDIPEPNVNLGVGPGSHGEQTGKMLIGIEEVLLDVKPDFVLVYGDANSTLAGALVAAKLLVPIIHIEAGLRAYNRAMPEEINRVLTDHVSDMLMCPTLNAVDSLAKEGIRSGVYFVGDVMYDAFLAFSDAAEARFGLLHDLGVAPDTYILLTVHRPANVDDLARLQTVLGVIGRSGMPVIFPIHPRTKNAILGLGLPANVLQVDAVGYLDALLLEKYAKIVVTDSGGIQKEAYWAGTPCITLRNETEWEETAQAGWNRLVDADRERLRDAIGNFRPRADRPRLFGDGHAAEQIARLIEKGAPCRSSC